MLPVNPHDAEAMEEAKERALRPDLAEQNLLASMLVDATIAGELAPKLRPDDMARRNHQKVLAAIQSLVERSQDVNLISVRERIDAMPGGLGSIGGFDTLLDLAKSIPTTAHAGFYLQRVQLSAVRRQILGAAQRLTQLALDLDVDEAPVLINRAQELVQSIEVSGSEKTLRSFGEVMYAQANAIQEADEARSQGRRTSVVPTGFYDLDQLVQLTPGKLIVFAARPSMGKSAMAFQIACHVARTVPVLHVTLEMSGEELAGRIYAAELNIDSHAQAYGYVPENRWADLFATAEQYSHLKLYVDDTPAATIPQVEASARKVQILLGEPIGLVLIDYLGLLDGPGRDETAKVGAISRASKRLAKSLGCPVMLLSQLNRKVEERDNKRPQLADLRQSGAIEQDADSVWFAYRDEYYKPDTTEKGIAEIIVPKNRGGGRGTVRLYFDGPKTRFTGIDFKADDAFDPNAFAGQPAVWEGEDA